MLSSFFGYDHSRIGLDRLTLNFVLCNALKIVPFLTKLQQMQKECNIKDLGY